MLRDPSRRLVGLKCLEVVKRSLLTGEMEPMEVVGDREVRRLRERGGYVVVGYDLERIEWESWVGSDRFWAVGMGWAGSWALASQLKCKRIDLWNSLEIYTLMTWDGVWRLCTDGAKDNIGIQNFLDECNLLYNGIRVDMGICGEGLELEAD
ncbi:unnamed protein product [Dovyalis caffra]|uniref:Uncharacterized protein n=1 Tax=Dovyalis caffra TaxID=77055 RepID=A0AAV1RQK3_9ROSI|nr:unnamed protein product [Dovyalis caffra]